MASEMYNSRFCNGVTKPPSLRRENADNVLPIHLGLLFDARWNGLCYGFLMASEEEGDGDDSNGETTAIPSPIDRITKDAVTFSSPKDFLTTSPNMPSSSILSYQVLG